MSKDKKDVSFAADEVSAETSFHKMTASKLKAKLNWYYAPVFLCFWLVLFCAVILPIFFALPEGLRYANEEEHIGEFIAERAQRILFDFDQIGPKVAGSYANENLTVQLLHDEVAKIRNAMHHDLYNLEVDVQRVSGAYMRWTMINMYQGVQNFVVKFSAKNATSQSYLLINSHFDSKPGSPGTGDDGAMVVVMLEVLRVLATNRQTFKHPIVFLFNGAEENSLQASHGFVTQHKWAKNCKALINLDSAGSGNREILFQSGPNHPWLMNYYRQYAKVPYATTLAEELFQAGILPSDTDFRIFRDYGHVPGLDMAHSYNGYVYHTEFDKFNVIPRGSLQTTGDNVLALTRGFADAPELENIEQHAEGHVVFYDFMNLFLIYYTETESIIINSIVAAVTILLVLISLWRMATRSFMSLAHIARYFALIFALQLLGFILAFGLPLLMAVLYDSGDRSMTWFTNKWLVFGLYICPCLFGFSAPALIYLSLERNDKLEKPYKLQMVLHAHAIIMAIILLILTIIGIRTSYLFMISLIFYASALIINLATTLHDRGYLWSIFLILSQLLPFLYHSYLFYALSSTLMPMMGRFGSSLNPDLLVGGMVSLAAVLAMGFLIPLLSIFRRPKLVLLSLALITFIFSMLSLTHLGFPYRAKTNVGRVNFLHVRSVFYEHNGEVSRNISGYYFDFQDRRMHTPIESSVDLTGLESIEDDCEEYLACGLPVFNHRWYKARMQGKWLPAKEPVQLPGTPTLELLNKTINNSSYNAFYEFELTGPSHMSIFLQPLEGVVITNWSFLHEMLERPDKWPAPYHIFFSYGADNSPLRFHLKLRKPAGNIIDEPLFEMGIAAHYVSYEHKRGKAEKEFMQSFPDYLHIMEWPSSYERYIF